MEDKGYNGWKNYETWCVKLWLDNDEGSYRYWRQQAEQIIWLGGDRDTFCCTLAGQLQDEIADDRPDLDGMYADLLGAALSEVDWYEIAEAYAEECEHEHKTA